MSLLVTFGGVSMIDSLQIRAARSSLDWTIDKLASEASLNRRTVIRIEAKDSKVAASQKTLLAIQTALENAGIEFIFADDGARGILFRLPE